MECSTCHSVHNKGNGGETLLWRSDQNSELCLTCHDKGLYTFP
jgi:predicted CXXCH cytochrome family protein